MIDNYPAAYSVAMSINPSNLRHNQVLVFDSVILNSGKVYDKTCGIFTPTSKGVYVLFAINYYDKSRKEFGGRDHTKQQRALSNLRRGQRVLFSWFQYGHRCSRHRWQSPGQNPRPISWRRCHHWRVYQVLRHLSKNLNKVFIKK